MNPVLDELKRLAAEGQRSLCKGSYDDGTPVNYTDHDHSEWMSRHWHLLQELEEKGKASRICAEAHAVLHKAYLQQEELLAEVRALQAEVNYLRSKKVVYQNVSPRG